MTSLMQLLHRQSTSAILAQLRRPANLGYRPPPSNAAGVLLREEPGGPQNEQWKTVPLVEQPTKVFGREFADPINVARMERGNIFVDPGRTGRTATTSGTMRLRDHHRRGRGEHKPVDCRKRFARRLEQ